MPYFCCNVLLLVNICALALLIPLSDQDYKEDEKLLINLHLFKEEIETKFKEEEHKYLQEEAKGNRNIALMCSLPIFTAPFALPIAAWFEYHRRDYNEKVNEFKDAIKELGKSSFFIGSPENPGPISPQG